MRHDTTNKPKGPINRAIIIPLNLFHKYKLSLILSGSYEKQQQNSLEL